MKHIIKSDFLIIPKKVILNKNLISNLGNKLPYTISYLICATNKFNKCYFSLENLITTSGNSLRTGLNRNNEQFRSIIKELVNYNLLSVDCNMDKVNLATLIKGELLKLYDTNDKGQKINWFSVGIDDYLKILNSKTKLNKITLINLYFYILARIIRRNDKIKNITITGGVAEVFWKSQNNICKDLNISKQTLNTYLKHLKKLELIHYGNIGKIKKDKTIMEAPNIYATDEMELKYGLEQSKYYWENQGWKVITNN